MFERRITILAGHFGSGKTEIAVNAALDLAGRNEPVALVDLDVVKPYFRSRAAREPLAQAGVELIAPQGDNYYADLPIILPAVRRVCSDSRGKVIMDAGGDDTGARVLGSLADVLPAAQTDLLLVVNFRRPFTPDVPSAVVMGRAIEVRARLDITGIVSNTHLMGETTRAVIEEGYAQALETAQAFGVPVKGVAVDEDSRPGLEGAHFDCPLVVLRRLIRPDFDDEPKVRSTGPIFVLN